MRLASGLLAADDYRDALECEASDIRGLIPMDLDMCGLFDHPGAEEWVRRRCVGDFVPVPGQIVTVRKSGHGVRPVAELSVRDRVLYRALVRRWNEVLPEPDRSAKAYEDFLQAPLSTGKLPAYVVSSDVAACYEYIDHGLLAREVLARTGDSDGVEALTSLLAGIMGRSYGLPQQSAASDVLAEAYMLLVERRLLRQGWALRRYSDDFRIAVASWSEALKAVDALERECRSIGLTLNDLKTVIRKAATYQEVLDRRTKVLEGISEETAMDFTDIVQAPYGVLILIDSEKSEVISNAARTVVKEWLVMQKKMLDPSPESIMTQEEQEKRLSLTDLLRWALSVLQLYETDAATLAACEQILRTEQTLTPLVANYTSSTTDPVMTVDWFEKFLRGNPYLTPWQAWWMAPAIGATAGAYVEGSGQRRWLQSVWTDPACPEPVKAGIAFTVAHAGLADAQEMMHVFESMTDTGRPFLARAVGAVAKADDSGAATLLAEDEWVRWAFELGRDHD